MGRRGRAGDARLKPARTQATLAPRDRIAKTNPEEGMPIVTITKNQTEEERTMLKAQKLDTRKFIELHTI